MRYKIITYLNDEIVTRSGVSSSAYTAARASSVHHFPLLEVAPNSSSTVFTAIDCGRKHRWTLKLLAETHHVNFSCMIKQ